jgi:NitT/TauT family transport system substrate-binding protein
LRSYSERKKLTNIVRTWRVKTRSLLNCVLLIVLTGLLSCSKSELTEVSFGYQPFGSNLAFFVAMEKGYFTERGVTVSPVRIISANDAANAVVNGDIAGNATVPLNVMLNIEENQPGLMKICMVKATSSKAWSDYLLVKKGSKITSIEQLKGKKIGGYPGSAQQTLIKLILGKFLEKNDIITVEMPPNTQLQGLDAGQIDALLTYDDLAVMAIDNNIADVLVENPISKYVVDPMYGFPYVLSAKFVRDNPGPARKIRDAMYQAADFIKEHDSEARVIMAKLAGPNAEIAGKVRLWDQVKAENVDREALQKLADLYYDAGVTQKRVNTSGFYLSEDDLR